MHTKKSTLNKACSFKHAIDRKYSPFKLIIGKNNTFVKLDNFGKNGYFYDGRLIIKLHFIPPYM